MQTTEIYRSKFNTEWNEITTFLKKYQSQLNNVFLCPVRDSPEYVHYENWKKKSIERKEENE